MNPVKFTTLCTVFIFNRARFSHTPRICAVSKTMSQTSSVDFLSEFDPFVAISFGKCRRAVGLFYFTSIHVYREPRGVPALGAKKCGRRQNIWVILMAGI